MRIKPPALYLHRATIDGRDRPVGRYTVDVRTKTVGRIFKATGVYPTDKNAAEIVAQIHAMIRTLDLQRDDRRLGQIKLGKVKLLDAFNAYKAGRINAAEAHSGDLLAPSLWKWLKRYTASSYTTTQYTAHIRRLERIGLIKKSTTVRQVPDIVRTLRAKFNREHKAIVFQSMRGIFLSFLKSGLGYDEDSYVLKSVVRTPLVPIRSRREHHPLRSLHDLMALCQRVNTEGRWKNRCVDYKSWIYFMAFTGLRPTEFERGIWSVDDATGHLRIRGTKTANAHRVIPFILFLEPKPRRLANLQMRLINLNPATPVRREP